MTIRHFDVQEALEVYETNFDHILRVACALSLAALNMELISLVTKSLDRKLFKLSTDKIDFDFRLWGTHLKQKHKLDDERIQSLVDNFKIWYDITAKSEFDVIRWLCHGHIGEAVLWSAYGACVYEACVNASIPEHEIKVRSVGKRVRYTTFITSWIQIVLEESPQDTPLECLMLLGIQLV